jgi:hypothetical protein
LPGTLDVLCTSSWELASHFALLGNRRSHMAGVVTYSMEDRGRRRIDYLMDLHMLWSDGLAIATQGYMTKSDKEMQVKLEHAIELLDVHMQNDFSFQPYSKGINDLPKNAKEISDEESDEPGFAAV